jgi:hypothetical protein
MKVEPDSKGFVDGALLVDAERSENRKRIADLILANGRLVMIKNREDHLTVHFMVKSSGEPQFCIDFWTEDRSSTVTDTMNHARQLAEQFTQGTEHHPGA